MRALRWLWAPSRPSPAVQSSDRAPSTVTHSTRGPSKRSAVAQQRAVAVGDREVGAGERTERQLVGVVRLGVAGVPGEVVGVERRHRHDGRGGAGVGRLVARHLDDPVVDVGRGVGVVGRRAEVAADHDRVSQTAQQVSGHRRRRALALGAGHAQDPRPVGLLQPQAQGADHRRPAGLDVLDLGAVAADPGGLDHHVAAQQGVETQAPRGHDRAAVEAPVGRPVVDEHGLDPERGELADGGPALDPEPPDPDRAAGEVRPGDRWSRTHRGCGARRRRGAWPRRRRGWAAGHRAGRRGPARPAWCGGRAARRPGPPRPGTR